MLIDGNMIISGFVSKGVNNLVDYSWNKIKDANNKRKSPEQNIESRIYQVIVDAINMFTFNEYKERDTLYIAAESIFKGFKEGRKYVEAVKMGLKMLESQITDDRCEDFLGTLCDEICKDKNDILYKAININQNEQIIENMHKGFSRSEQNQKDIKEGIHKSFERSERNNQETQRKLNYLVERTDNKEINLYSEIRVENRAKEYADKWDKNMFLNDFKKRDKKAGVSVKLKDIYLEEQLPHYLWKTNDKSLRDLKELLREYTVDNDGKNMLLILGQAGIGKSTLITWMMVNFKEKKDDFLVYQFASDLKNVDWQGDNVLCEIFKILNLKYDELDNRVLILDGFDEIYASSDREGILNRLNQELAEITILKNFSLIITCRENYVYKLRNIECDFITLQIWDDKQIKRFYDIYEKEKGCDISGTKLDKILKNKEVFGIPLILYMVLALDIIIEKGESLVDIYDQIFSLDRSSIYDRCIDNSRYGKKHRISESKIKKQIHLISQRIAFWIFENNSEKAYINQKDYEEICNNVIGEILGENDDIKRDFLIGNYFKFTKHCEGVGTNELQFIHRSIYEYFVVVYFFNSLHNLTSKEVIAGKLGELLKDGTLSDQIVEFIKYKFDTLKAKDLTNLTREVFQIMLRDGMIYHVNGRYKNGIKREMNIFSNMLKVVHLWNPTLGELDNKIICYLQHNYWDYLDLRGVDLFGVNLKGANLFGANLEEANLFGVNLIEANLEGANLRGVNLGGAHLFGVNLKGANLEGANLSESDLSESDLRGANLEGANLSESNLKGANLERANLSESDLTKSNLVEASLSEANLFGANLEGINLSELDLSKVIFEESICTLSDSNSEFFPEVICQLLTEDY